MYLYSDADDGYCKHVDYDDYDDDAVAANMSSYLRDDTQSTLLSEVLIACSSLRHYDKSEDRIPNSYTRQTYSNLPPTTSSIDSRSALKRTRTYCVC